MRRFTAGICVLCLTVLFTPTPAPAAISAARKSLNSTLPELRFDNVTLGDAFDFLRDVSGANIHVNWKALEEIGVGKEATINVRLRTVTLRKVLNLVLSEASSSNLLTFYIDDNIIEVTTRELADKDMITKVYPVDDLIMEVPDFEQQAPQFQLRATPSGRGGGGGGQSIFGSAGTGTRGGTGNTRQQLAQQLVDLIQATVKPEIWTTAGGPAAIRFWNGSLIVTAPRSVHEMLGSPGD
jgi:hypothetical protein